MDSAVGKRILEFAIVRGMSNLWQETPKMDSPWNSEGDGWGTPSDGWTQKRSEPSTDWSANSDWASSKLETPTKTVGGGWGLEESSEPQTATAAPLSSPEHAWDAPAEESSWLSAGPTKSEEMFAPRWAEVEDAVEPDEGWLDEDNDEFSALAEGESVATSGGGGGVLWLAVVALGLLTVFGLWSLTGKEDKPAVDPEVAAITEALESGRLLVDAGQQSLQSKKAENAASQLRKAVEELVKGKAPAEEVWKARRLLAKATYSSKQFEESHAVWSQLATQQAFRAEAGPAAKQAAAELRKRAATDLNTAGALLAQGNADRAAAFAKESLSIYQRFDGDRTQLGRANGALGSALAKQGRLGAARSYLAAAVRHWPENRSYAAALDTLGAGPYEAVPEVETSATAPVVTSVASGRIDAETGYPAGQTGLGGSSSSAATSASSSAASVQTTSSSTQTTSANRNTTSTGGSRSSSSGGTQTGTKPGDEGVLDSYRNSGRRRRR